MSKPFIFEKSRARGHHFVARTASEAEWIEIRRRLPDLPTNFSEVWRLAERIFGRKPRLRVDQGGETIAAEKAPEASARAYIDKASHTTDLHELQAALLNPSFTDDQLQRLDDLISAALPVSTNDR